MLADHLRFSSNSPAPSKVPERIVCTQSRSKANSAVKELIQDSSRCQRSDVNYDKLLLQEAVVLIFSSVKWDDDRSTIPQYLRGCFQDYLFAVAGNMNHCIFIKI